MLKGILVIIAALFILIIVVAFIIQYTQTSFYNGPSSNHFDGKKFYNLAPYKTKDVLDILQWRIHNHKQQWPNHVKNTAHPDLSVVNNAAIKVTFVNHATVLIQTKNLTILTDPVWSERVSPVSWLGPKRVHDPGIAFNELPKVDVVIISHNHYDHLDLATLKKLETAFHPLFLVPLGDQALLQRNGITHVMQLDWWQVYQTDKFKITFLPTQHWSARWLNDKCATLWGSYGIEIDNRKIYFAGDTGYSKNFALIKQQWGQPDLAFLPIGSYLPEWFMQQNHMNPSEAIRAHQDLSAKKSVAIHFGTFQLSDEGINQPVEDLRKAISQESSLASDFLILQVGETKVF